MTKRNCYVLSVGVCAVFGFLLSALMLVLILAPARRDWHDIVGWTLAIWCVPCLPAAYFLQWHAHATTRQIEPSSDEVPFRLRPNRAYFGIVGGLCALIVLFPLAVSWQRGDLFQLTPGLAVLVLGSALIFWMATGSRATLFNDRLVHSYCGWHRTLALAEVKSVQIYFERNSFILMFNNSPRHRITLAHHSEVSVVRLLELLHERAPNAQWDERARQWREGQVTG